MKDDDTEPEPLNLAASIAPAALKWFCRLQWPVPRYLRPPCDHRCDTPKALGPHRWIECEACGQRGKMVTV
jgi:hypothetical protein